MSCSVGAVQCSCSAMVAESVAVVVAVLADAVVVVVVVVEAGSQILCQPARLLLLLLLLSFLAGPHLPALDCSGPRRISTASSRSQWASPDCQLLIAVVVAGPHLPALDCSGPRRTSTCESLRAVGLAGPQPARVGALYAR